MLILTNKHEPISYKNVEYNSSLTFEGTYTLVDFIVELPVGLCNLHKNHT